MLDRWNDMRFLLFKLAYKHRCTFLSLVCTVLLIGCGKKVNNIDSDPTSTGEFLLPGSVFIEAEKLKDIYGPQETPIPEEFRYIDGEYPFPRLAQVTIPSEVHVINGNASNNFAYVFFNEYENAFDFYCLYKGGSSSSQPSANSNDEQLGLKYNFVDCYDELGNDLGLDPGMKTWIDKDNSIEVHIEGADPRYDTKTLTTIDVTWT